MRECRHHLFASAVDGKSQSVSLIFPDKFSNHMTDDVQSCSIIAWATNQSILRHFLSIVNTVNFGFFYYIILHYLFEASFNTTPPGAVDVTD